MTTDSSILTSSADVTRGLNFFDGRFLRAEDLNAERRAQRAYVDYSNRAGGPGIVYGFEVTFEDAAATINPGLLVDRAGRLLVLDRPYTRDIGMLIAPSTGVADGTTAGILASGFAPCAAVESNPETPGTGLYVVTVQRTEVFEGQEDILGKLCDSGCAGATNSRFVVDAIDVRAIQLTQLSLPTGPGVSTATHERSQVASALFERERTQGGSLLSASGLSLPTWQTGTPETPSDGGIPLAVFKWDGTNVTWSDLWSVRRERMDASPSAYWGGHLELRTRSAFMAQVLQFQAQMLELTPGVGSGGILLASGLITLSPAGYLTTKVGSGVALRAELESLFGPGVALRVSAVRRDQIPHELERATHIDRISLVRGLLDPAAREQVDVLVPNGVLESTDGAVSTPGFAVDLALGSPGSTDDSLATRAAHSTASLALKGVARLDVSAGLAIRVALAGTGKGSLMSAVRPVTDLIRGRVDVATAAKSLGKVKAETEPVSLALLREMASAAVTRAAEARGSGSGVRVVKLPPANGTVASTTFSLWAGLDVFAMADRQATAVHAEGDIIVPQAASVHWASVSLDARLVQLSSKGTADGREVTVQVDGVAEVSGPGAGGSDFKAVSQKLVLKRTGSGGNERVEITDPDSGFTATVRWSGAPVVAMGGASDVPIPEGSGFEMLPASFEATETGSVDVADNDYRDAAVSAVQLVSALHADEAGYVKSVLDDLLPLSVSTSEGAVRPVEDWVFFRRRRREEFEGAQAFTSTGTSDVAAWVVTADDQDQAEDFRQALVGGGTATMEWGGSPVDTLSFEARTATLRSSSEHWRERYAAVGGGDVIWFAGYGKALSSTDPPIGTARAQELVHETAALAQLDESGPDNPVDLVPSPPAGQMISGTEGSIFLITYPSAQKFTVFAVDGTNAKFADTVAAVKAFDAEKLKGANVDAFTAVSGELQTGNASKTDIDAAIKKIDDLAEKLDTDKTGISRDVFVWVRGGPLGERAGLAALVSATGDATPTHQAVEFTPDDDERVRVYVVLEPITAN